MSHIQVLEERTRGLEYKLDQSQNRIKQLELEKNQLEINFKECENGLNIIDQHAAHERIKFELLKKNKYIYSYQKLLIPELISFFPLYIDISNELSNRLKKYGILIDKKDYNCIYILVLLNNNYNNIV